MFPPHLPAPSCNIKEHHRWQRIKLIIAAAVFGLAGGMTGASIVLGWIWPGYGGGETLMIARGSVVASDRQLEEKVRSEISERIASVYSAGLTESGLKYLPEENKLGEAIVVGSDGWLAMSAPEAITHNKNYQVVFANGRVFGLEKIVYDSEAKVAYLKVLNSVDDVTSQFKVISFVGELAYGDSLFTHAENNWSSLSVAGVTYRGYANAHLDTAPLVVYNLFGDKKPASIVINNQGKFAGFVETNGTILPAQEIERTLSSVLVSGQATYPSLGVEGWFSEEQPVVIDRDVKKGFLVTKVVGRNSLLRRSDLIMEINGQIVDPANFWYNVNGRDNVNLKIWRQGKVLDLSVLVTKISF
ncbi:MAG TPA: S1C family serine protease [Patescibacteria group bacterium]|nr:S1C family serine protease [Patescibacteria group bacterium]